MVADVSIKVDIDELGPELERYGTAAFVLSSSGEGRPHVIELRVKLVDGKLVGSPGRSCARNVQARPELSVLWPAFEAGGLSLIVDGTGEITTEGDTSVLTVTPSGGVLHRAAPQA